ncbi:hypothetical protein ScPMuIL_010296 [Solemya velum]
MARAGSSAPMMNINLNHNCDRIDLKSKTQYATCIAQFMAEQVAIPIDRVLVLFFDTRKCSSLTQGSAHDGQARECT